MRLDWLEDILAVAQTGSFTEAAERRGLTQSAFSRRIRQIEDHVGVDLFDRSRKPVQLRPATEDQRSRIEDLAAQLRQLTRDLHDGERSAAHRIVIASQHSLTAALTPAILDQVRTRRADVFVRLTSANLDGCLADLLARKADVAILYRLPRGAHPVRADFVDVLTLGADRLIPVIGTAHLAAVQAALDDGRVPCISYPGDVFLGQVTERHILAQLRQGAQLELRAETALTLAALELAATGLGIAWVPLSLAERGLAAGRLSDLSDRLPACALEVTAVRLRGEAGAAQQAVWADLADLAIVTQN